MVQKTLRVCFGCISCMENFTFGLFLCCQSEILDFKIQNNNLQVTFLFLSWLIPVFMLVFCYPENSKTKKSKFDSWENNQELSGLLYCWVNTIKSIKLVHRATAHDKGLYCNKTIRCISISLFPPCGAINVRFLSSSSLGRLWNQERIPASPLSPPRSRPPPSSPETLSWSREPKP